MLEGTLGDFSLTDIFQLIALTKKTGALTVTSADRQGRVLFKGGEVSFAVADVERVAIGARLYAAGLVDEDRIVAILERKRDRGGDVLDMLGEEAALDDGTLSTFLREQIEDAIFDLMRLDAAAFHFDAAGGTDDEPVGLTVPTENLILEGGRRLGEWAAIRDEIPSVDAVLALSSAPPTDCDAVSLTVEEWRLLSLLDGRRTVREVVELTGKGEFAISNLLADLATRGFVQVVRAEGEPTGALADMVAHRDLLRRLEEMELGAPATRTQPIHAPGAGDAAPPDAAPRFEPSDAAEPVAEGQPGQEPLAAPVALSVPEPETEPLEEPAAEAVPEPAVEAVPEPAVEAVPEPASQQPASVEEPGDGPSADGHTGAEPVTPRQEPLEGRPLGQVDRSQVARELASLGLGDDAGPSRPPVEEPAERAKPPVSDEDSGRLTRDEDVNKGLLLRLIDGVKGA